MGDKAQRISSLAASIAAMIGADAEMAKLAGLLAKADLVSETVGEFPELQGVIGGYLAERDENKSIAQAIAGHYRPEGPGDAVPEDLVTIAVALSDKIDSLTGFFGIGELPTGSKDPFALRRAALGVLRLITHNKLELRLKDVFDLAAKGYGFDAASDALMPFLHDRLKVWLRDEGIRHDVVAAVLRLDDPRHDDLIHLCRLAKALADVLETEDGQGLMAGYRRASNILNAEEKKDQKRFDGMVDVTQLSSDAEITLNEQINSMAGHSTATTDAIIDQINRLGGLRAPIDAFFENTTVNDDDQRVRENRLNLLGQVRQLMEVLANFSAIEG